MVLSDWGYKRQITVTNNTGGELTDVPVQVELDSSNFDFLHANDDGSDIRFTGHYPKRKVVITSTYSADLNNVAVKIEDPYVVYGQRYRVYISDPSNPLPYWIEKTGRMYVKVTVPAMGSVPVYYYPDDTAPAPDGFSVFEFFDDFESYEEGDIDGQGGWIVTKNGGTTEVVTVDGRKMLHFYGYSFYATISHSCILSCDEIGWELHTAVWQNSEADNLGDYHIVYETTICDGRTEHPGYHGLYTQYSTYNICGVYKIADCSSSYTNLGNTSYQPRKGWHNLKLIWTYTQGNDESVLAQYIDNYHLVTVTDSDPFSSCAYIGLFARHTGSAGTPAVDLYFDWVFVRRNIDDKVELSFSFEGDEKYEWVLPYWVEKWSVSEEVARVWVKVPVLPVGDSTLVMYYGNSSAEDVGNGDCIFVLFDHFDNVQYDHVKWSVTDSSNIDHAESEIVLEKSVELITNQQFAGPIIVTTGVRREDTTSSHDLDWEIRLYNTAKGECVNCGLGGGSNDGQFFLYQYAGGWIKDDQTNVVMDITTDRHILTYDGTNYAGEYKAYSNSAQVQADLSSFCIKLRVAATNPMKAYVDYVYVRDYIDPEPSTVVGEEQATSVTYYTDKDFSGKTVYRTFVQNTMVARLTKRFKKLKDLTARIKARMQKTNDLLAKIKTKMQTQNTSKAAVLLRGASDKNLTSAILIQQTKTASATSRVSIEGIDEIETRARIIAKPTSENNIKGALLLSNTVENNLAAKISYRGTQSCQCTGAVSVTRNVVISSAAKVSYQYEDPVIMRGYVKIYPHTHNTFRARIETGKRGDLEGEDVSEDPIGRMP